MSLQDWSIALPATAAASALLTGASIPLARRAGALDRPGEIKIHRTTTPRLGGLGFTAAVLLSAVALRTMSGTAMVGLIVMALVGYLDDCYSISPRAKLAGQCLSGVLLALHFALLGSPPWIVAGAFALAVVLSNAFNLLDGMNGLAAGCSLISTVAVAAIAGAAGARFGVGPGLAGALLGFIPWNYPRARTFMGDIGSLSLGYLLALGVSEAGTAGAGAWLAAAGTVALPVFDVALGILRRRLRGVPIFSGDRDHFYDQIHRRTRSLSRTTALVWSAVAGSCVLCVAFARAAPPVVGGVLLGLVVSYAGLAYILGFVNPEPG